MFTLDKFLNCLGVSYIYFCLVICFGLINYLDIFLFHSNKVKEKARVTCTPVYKVKDDADHLDCAKNPEESHIKGNTYQRLAYVWPLCFPITKSFTHGQQT